jgi:DNA polymerase
MDLIVFDFETYYSQTYSLSKTSVEEYVRSPEFEILMVGVKLNDEPAKVFTPAMALDALLQLESSYPDSVWVAHNARFDGFILEDALDIHPKTLICTQLMARYLGVNNFASLSLSSLANLFNLGVKGDYLVNSINKRLNDFTAYEYQAFANYCAKDVELTYSLFQTLLSYMSWDALAFINMTLRMYTDPRLELDAGLLKTYLNECVIKQERDRDKLRALFEFETTDEFLKALRSRKKFGDMLTQLGVEIPMKVSATAEANVKAARELMETSDDKVDVARAKRALDKGIMTPALAKTDEGFIELLNSSDEDVALLARLRAENNSSIGVSRAETLIAIEARGQTLPVPLLAWGAHTGRYTADGADRLNLQNLPKQGDLTLRKAIKAPAGYKIVAGDSAQIEARVGAYLAEQNDLVDLFRRKEDPYVDMAAAISGRPAEEIAEGAKVRKEKTYVDLRTIGKITVLSSQYGIGAEKFAKYLKRANIVLGETPEAHLDEARRINRLYNDKNYNIREFRYYCQQLLESMTNKTGSTTISRLNLRCYFQPTPCVVLPSGFKLVYPELRMEIDDYGKREFFYFPLVKGRKIKKYIYGGLLFNNLVQGISFDILRTQGLMISSSYKMVSNIHDSWVCLVPEKEVDLALNYILYVLRLSPNWAGDLPLDGEVTAGDSYEKA